MLRIGFRIVAPRRVSGEERGCRKFAATALLLAASVAVAAEPKGGVVTEEAKKYWAYQPVTRPPVPDVTDKNWVKNPIDAFVLAKLDAKGLTPAKPAERIALIRRAFYDLTGLPPAPEEVETFVKSTTPQAAY